ncbi:alpha/beta hydrolase [Luteibacter sp. PPL201]|uniref:Alpha/beta hydrolase n=1 Tax=Luteibacter sahnii TaxID=3021977 RepID=A0ABT6BBF7_9GAMM|nr:alpha/beta fold hydrolase [Luteibacter sp. PPL193]MDY1547392.1 alpha/beta hydrolase [Luteibacter sp. PPL193]
MRDDPPDASVLRQILPLTMADGARAELRLHRPPDVPRASLLWVPALGVAARHYDAFAQAMATRGIAVGVHEWRGHGSSDRRAGRRCDWGYRELLGDDLPHSAAALRAVLPDRPLLLGGHSLGGQIACLFAAAGAVAPSGLVLVASGAPYWRRFRPWVYLAYVAAPLLARLNGRLPGRRIGFGGNEARGVIADWARSGRTGRYSAKGHPVDLEAALRGQSAPIAAWVLRDDWLAPASSLQFLLDKMPDASRAIHAMTPAALGTAADHFAWMTSPAALVERIAAALPCRTANAHGATLCPLAPTE